MVLLSVMATSSHWLEATTITRSRRPSPSTSAEITAAGAPGRSRLEGRRGESAGRPGPRARRARQGGECGPAGAERRRGNDGEQLEGRQEKDRKGGTAASVPGVIVQLHPPSLRFWRVVCLCPARRRCLRRLISPRSEPPRIHQCRRDEQQER